MYDITLYIAIHLNNIYRHINSYNELSHEMIRRDVGPQPKQTVCVSATEATDPSCGGSRLATVTKRLELCDRS